MDPYSRLWVIDHDGHAQVTICRNRRLKLKVRSGTSAAEREKALQQWFLAATQSPGACFVGSMAEGRWVEVADCGIKATKSYWGDARAKTRAELANLESAKKHPLRLTGVHPGA